MGSAKRRRLIVNADDFGLSSSVNQAVIQAHQNGILTSASLMVAGNAFDEAVNLARRNPTLAVGLHLTLCCGKPVLTPSEIPSLVGRDGRFSDSPVRAGMKYYFSSSARAELEKEIDAQFERFNETNLKLDHVNGHLHFHLHPVVLEIVLRQAGQRNVRSVRLTNDPLSIDRPLHRGRWIYRLTHAAIFSTLSKHARTALRSHGLAHTDAVFGLLANARVTEDYILRLLHALPAGDSELYSHPSLGDFRHEYEALVSDRVREAVAAEEIELIRYQDLW